MVGFIAVWPHNRIVQVKVEQSDDSIYPFRVTSLQVGVKINHLFFGEDGGVDSFCICDPSFINLYKSRQQAERCELEKLHDAYLQEKRAMRKQEKRVKMANKQIAEYKAFGQTQSFIE